MLNKRQYKRTLGAAVAAFFIFFAIAYTVSISGKEHKDRSLVIQTPSQQVQANVPIARYQEPVIGPTTHITLHSDEEEILLKGISLDATTLLGLNQQDLQECFDAYSIPVFNENEVRLVKGEGWYAQAQLGTEEERYVLAIDHDKLCVKETDSEIIVGYIAKETTDLSSYLYSMLLREQIRITETQKEVVLRDASALQKILQSHLNE